MTSLNSSSRVGYPRLSLVYFGLEFYSSPMLHVFWGLGCATFVYLEHAEKHNFMSVIPAE